MPVIPSTGQGPSNNPDAGNVALATFVPNDPVASVDGLRGFVPGPPAATPTNYVLQASGQWGLGGSAATFVPAIAFTGSAAGGVGQVFTDSNLRLYTLAQDVQLFVNRTTKLIGVSLGSDFTLDNVAGSITVSFSLPASASLFIDSKVVLGIGETYYFLNEDGLSRFLDENGIDIFRKETNT